MDALRIIGYMHSDFPTKFGLPRQSGLNDRLLSHVVMEEAYSVEEAFRGLGEYSHIWLLWGFSEAERDGWQPTVRPPRLGGNKRMGVFATRSPYRPNSIGLSSVRLLDVGRDTKSGRMVLTVAGADLMDGTPIYDLKPYLRYTDSHPDAVDGFAGEVFGKRLTVVLPTHLRGIFPPDKEAALIHLLEEDPRPSYQNDSDRVYGFPFAGYEIRFRVREDHAVVDEILPIRA